MIFSLMWMIIVLRLKFGRKFEVWVMLVCNYTTEISFIRIKEEIWFTYRAWIHKRFKLFREIYKSLMNTMSWFHINARAEELRKELELELLFLFFSRSLKEIMRQVLVIFIVFLGLSLAQDYWYGVQDTIPEVCAPETLYAMLWL